MTVFLYFLAAAALGVFVLAWAQIFLKVGYNRWLCLLMLLPIVNLFVIYWFAFSHWPVYDFVEKDWDVKRLVRKQQEIARQIQDLTGQELRVEEDLGQPKKQESPSAKVGRNRIGSPILVIIAIVIAGFMIFIGWLTSYYQYSTLQNKYYGLNVEYSSLMNKYDGLVRNTEAKETEWAREKERLVSNIEAERNELAAKLADLTAKEAALDAKQTELAAKEAELAGKEAGHEKLRVNYENVTRQLNEIKRLYPPRHFANRDELVAWRTRTGPVSGDTYFLACNRLQELAIADGFIVSTGAAIGTPALEPACFALAGDVLFRLFPAHPDEVTWFFKVSK